ncbi:hypothetical protein ACWIUD_05440 [Helicobacter sp. 23-1044]
MRLAFDSQNLNVDCFGESMICLAVIGDFTHPLNPPPQGRGRILDCHEVALKSATSRNDD